MANIIKNIIPPQSEHASAAMNFDMLITPTFLFRSTQFTEARIIDQAIAVSLCQTPFPLFMYSARQLRRARSAFCICYLTEMINSSISPPAFGRVTLIFIGLSVFSYLILFAIASALMVKPRFLFPVFLAVIGRGQTPEFQVCFRQRSSPGASVHHSPRRSGSCRKTLRKSP